MSERTDGGTLLAVESVDAADVEEDGVRALDMVDKLRHVHGGVPASLDELEGVLTGSAAHIERSATRGLSFVSRHRSCFERCEGQR